MAATDNRFIIYLLAFTLLFTLSLSSSDPPQISPSPSPQLASDAPPPTAGSPPAPPPSSSDLAPTPSPSSVTSSSPSSSISPSPDAAVASDVSNVKTTEESSSEEDSSSSSSGKKVAIAFGVIGAACVVVFLGMLYRKRQYNIRRAEFSAAARTEFL